MGGIGAIFTVYQDNLRLKEENARLRQWRNAAMVLEDRVSRYKLLLRAVPDPALSSVLARVIGRASKPFLETMILDAGKAHGVKPGQAVVDARGMIGRVFVAGERTSWVVLLTDLNSHIPVLIQPGNIQAIMAGDNTSAPILDTLARRIQLKAGAQVISSGDGSLLPQGLPIGTVYQDGSNFRVALLADPSTSQDVEIVDFKRKMETPPPVAPSDLPATAAGLAPVPPQPAPTATQPAPIMPPPSQGAAVQQRTPPTGQPAPVAGTAATAAPAVATASRRPRPAVRKPLIEANPATPLPSAEDRPETPADTPE
jgi:rod shape-determining protein MreC